MTLGDWPDPRDPRLKDRVAQDLAAWVKRAGRDRQQPLEMLANLAFVLAQNAVKVAAWSNPAAVLQVLDRLGAEDGPSPLPALSAREKDHWGAALTYVISTGLPTGAPAWRAIAWVLMLAAAEQARLEHGPSGVRLAASAGRAALLERWPELAQEAA